MIFARKIPARHSCTVLPDPCLRCSDCTGATRLNLSSPGDATNTRRIKSFSPSRRASDAAKRQTHNAQRCTFRVFDRLRTPVRFLHLSGMRPLTRKVYVE